MSTPQEPVKPETPAAHDSPAPAAADEQKTESQESVDVEKLKEDFQEKARMYLIEQSRHVIIPSFAKWFDMNDIHAIEKKLFPDYFAAENGALFVSSYKSAQTYKHMRDFMINTYRINPIEYLTVTAVRRNLAGDVGSVIRIHRFLEKWGLINYQIDPNTKPSLVGPQYTGHFQITLDTPKGLTPFVPESVSGATPKNEAEDAMDVTSDNNTAVPKVAVKEEEDENAAIPLNMEITRNIFDNSKSQKTLSSVSFYCSETANDISDVRYHNLKSKVSIGGSLGPSVISKDCYEQGLFPLNFTASDFIKLDRATAGSEWTQQETLLLLEGVEMYGSCESNPQSLFINSNGQWDKISEHVATKTRSECLTRFLQLPIEDKYLQNVAKPEKTGVVGEGIPRDTIILEVVSKLIETNQGRDILKQNGKEKLEESIQSQSNLINQVIELTLEKFEAKMKVLDRLEADLVKTENLLNLQRKQVLVERWLNFEKLSKFKKQTNNPDLEELLDDLLTPINIKEVNENFNKTNLEDASEVSAVQKKDQIAEDMPISVVEPKAYLSWSV
ncbi:hypothetical protein PUMCH_000486 [Australozyma saopauloensis]|uniref:Chromatin structure-remodeling complex protein RSC8 n=1 Tax=Australozyma saopauloensis TaxID=291208 RepID=A0AAX4H4A1_9ASCO|nr:hypothetical protein PUMCH_000486 [[Candida] saopauloensis]